MSSQNPNAHGFDSQRPAFSKNVHLSNPIMYIYIHVSDPDPDPNPEVEESESLMSKLGGSDDAKVVALYGQVNLWVGLGMEVGARAGIGAGQC